MNYKLLAADMDGTLLNASGMITPKTREAVLKLTSNGDLFVLATGRPIQAVRNYCRQLELSGPVITYNGAVIVDLKEDRILWKKDLLFEDALKVWEIGQEEGATLCVWSENQLYTNQLNDRINQYKKKSDVEPILLKDISSLQEAGVTKIVWCDTKERISQVRSRLHPDQFRELTLCLSDPALLEFFHCSASKGNALKRIGELYGISREEIIAVGDAENDLSMISYAGLGVAMNNAQEQVKRTAQYITASNEEDGVKAVIERFFR